MQICNSHHLEFTVIAYLYVCTVQYLHILPNQYGIMWIGYKITYPMSQHHQRHITLLDTPFSYCFFFFFFPINMYSKSKLTCNLPLTIPYFVPIRKPDVFRSTYVYLLRYYLFCICFSFSLAVRLIFIALNTYLHIRIDIYFYFSPFVFIFIHTSLLYCIVLYIVD